MPNATEKEMPMNALLGMEFKILGSNLAAIYEKGTNGYKMLVVPVNQEK